MLRCENIVILRIRFLDVAKFTTLTLSSSVYTEKSKYVLLSHHQKKKNDIKVGNRCFENVIEFTYLGTNTTNQTLFQEEIKRRLNSGNACYHSVQNLLSSRLLSKNTSIKNKIYKTIILTVVLYWCETWSLTLREEHGLRVFENSLLRRIFGPKRY
jgi:hypothetical protein